MLPLSWKPVPAEDLLLVGPKEDGGYFVSEGAIANVGTLISMGLYDDWRFEEDFRRRSGAKVICFDHSVTRSFWLLYTIKALLRLRIHKLGKYLKYKRFFNGLEVRHERLMIGPDGDTTISLSTILKQVPPDEMLFLKMDIEGGEYEIFDQIVAAQARFSGLAMELHGLDMRRAEIERFFVNMSEFVIVAAHPNNYCAADENGDPILLEVSMTRRDLFRRGSNAKQTSLPPTVAHNPDIELQFG